MKAGDRVSITLHNGIDDIDAMCVAVEGSSKSTLMLITEDGECLATIRQFWQKTTPMLGDDSRGFEAIKHEKRAAKEIKRCEAPGCNKFYHARKADLARGWGKTCCKSCAAKLREHKNNLEKKGAK